MQNSEIRQAAREFSARLENAAKAAFAAQTAQAMRPGLPSTGDAFFILQECADALAELEGPFAQAGQAAAAPFHALLAEFPSPWPGA